MISSTNSIAAGDLKWVGGGIIGRARATWPFATLTVNRYMLKLSVSIAGTVVFRREDVVSITPFSGIKGTGIKINHTVGTYKGNICFLTTAGAEYLIREIRASGFTTSDTPLPESLADEINRLQASGSFPVRTAAVIFFVAMWNLLFVGGFLPFLTGHVQHLSLTGPKLATTFAIIFCIATLFLPAVRRMVLKEGRNLIEIKGFLYFLLVISAFILAVTLLLPV